MRKLSGGRGARYDLVPFTVSGGILSEILRRTANDTEKYRTSSGQENAGCLRATLPGSQSVPARKPVAARARASTVVQFAFAHHFSQSTFDGRLAPEQVAALQFLDHLVGRQAMVDIMEDPCDR